MSVHCLSLSSSTHLNLILSHFEGDDELDRVICQSSCNDIEKKDNDEIMNELNELVRVTKQKFTDKNIIKSLPLPRKELCALK